MSEINFDNAIRALNVENDPNLGPELALQFQNFCSKLRKCKDFKDLGDESKRRDFGLISPSELTSRDLERTFMTVWNLGKKYSDGLQMPLIIDLSFGIKKEDGESACLLANTVGFLELDLYAYEVAPITDFRIRQVDIPALSSVIIDPR